MALEKLASPLGSWSQTDTLRSPRERLPTMYDLPSEDPEEPGLPDEFHLLQPQLLRETFRPATYPPERIFVGIDMNLYYTLNHPRWHKRPDWFAVLGVSRWYAEADLRLSYVIWQEEVSPYLLVELLSPGTEADDLGRTPYDIQQPPTKWMVYEQILQIPYYVVFSRHTGELHYFVLQEGRYREVHPADGRLRLPEAGLGIGLWRGAYEGLERDWLRFCDANGVWVPTPLEREQQRAEQEHLRAEQGWQQAEQERLRAEQGWQQAEQERLRAERLAAQLKARGIEPE